ncbi:MAG: copper chaperone PCu(A)C [Cocleimonas sp.]|nr:copper chaperone PCu(A)C [Cocleimonas sp.]
MKSIIQLTLALGVLLFSGLTFAKGVMVDDPYVRAIPPGQTISAAFMMLKNDSDKVIDLIKATSDSAKNVELHEHVHEDGMMKMRQISKISVAPKGDTALKPGGYHIMLIGLVKHIQPKDVITINLEFSDGSKQEIRAEVKKIMMGMMKGKMSMKKGMKFKQHANPMPNLMAVFKMMGDQLDLTDEQKSKLKAGIAERSPKVNELYASIKNLEKEIYEATLNSESLNKIDQLADKLMQARLALIKGKAGCRESAKEVLNDKQFQKVVELYRANRMPKPTKMDAVQAKAKLMKHVNPLPNLMQVVKKRADQLNLSKQQATDLKKWRDERGPVTQKLATTIVKLEVELLEAALNNEPVAKIDQLADSIMQSRVKMIRGKTLCRDNMKRILDNKQYAKVIALYKKM